MTPATALEKALATAKAAGLFFLADGSGFTLYRRMPTTRVFLGRSKTEEALQQLVRRCASHR